MAVPWALAMLTVERKRHVRLLSNAGGGGYDPRPPRPEREHRDFETKCLTKDGRTFDASPSSPVRDAEGSVPRRSSATSPSASGRASAAGEQRTFTA
jgi:hypothetical protein